jgi:Domain of unknown function (DUF4132)
VARRLVWVSAGGTQLRVAEGRTLADVTDRTIEMPGEPVRIAHPLDLTGTLEA